MKVRIKLAEKSKKKQDMKQNTDKKINRNKKKMKIR